MFFVSAIAIVLVLALVVKPILSGETVQILPESKSSDTISNIPIPQGASATPYSPVITGTVSPTPTPLWDGSPKTVQFVDPSTYNLQWPSEVRDFGFRIPAYEAQENNSLGLYATIDGQWDATTQIINIPFPYWEIEVTLESIGDVGATAIEANVDYEAQMEEVRQQYNTGAITLQQYNEAMKNLMDLEEKFGSGDSGGGVEGLFSSEGSSTGAEAANQFYIVPSINVQVMDADKPNGIIYILNSRTEGPLPKVIDKAEGSASEDFFAEPEDSDSDSGDSGDVTGSVPGRDNINEFVWNHGFYEGAGNYYFIINPSMLKSYKIEIKVPTKYLNSLT